MAETQTIAITNFTGRLTRRFDGDLNSGFANFTNSFGYDPFSRPGNLTWLYQPTDIAGTSITDAVLAAKVWSFDLNARYVYGIGNSGIVYQINPTNSNLSEVPLQDSPSVIGKLVSGSPTFNYGADMSFYNSKMYFTSDSLITTTDFTGGSETVVGSVAGNLYHPQIQFVGKLYIGNGNNLMEVDATNTITNGAKLSPGLPLGMYIKDLDITPDGNYVIITASYLYPENISSPNSGDRGDPYAVESYQFLWNGTDAGVTAVQTLPAFPASSTNTFLDKQHFFNMDGFGAALYDGNQKLITMPQVLAPMPAASTPNGNFLSWVSPEVTGAVNSSTQGTNTYASLFYYGKLDGENETGLWRMLRQAPGASKKIWRTPLTITVNNFNFSTNFVLGWGKQYFSVFESGSPNAYRFYRFVLPPAANTNPILGVYQTQNQLFSKKITVKQVRIYCEPTATGNGIQLDMIGSDGSVISNGWNTNTYTFAAGSDPTTLTGSLERIDFNPVMKSTYSLGLRFTNTGTTNMVIHKVEVDWQESGK